MYCGRCLELENILKEALRDDYFDDHTCGVWQLEAVKILNIKFVKDLLGEDCENPDELIT